MKFKKRKKTEWIVIHCAATPPDMEVTAKMIDQWHRDRGWDGIGYHYVIRRDGVIEGGRPLEAQGAHVKGYNAVSVGICLAGGMSKDMKKAEKNYTDKQWDSLKQLVMQLHGVWPMAHIVGHHDLFSGKECPCFDVKEWLYGIGL